MLPLLDESDPQTWTEDNFRKTVAGLRLANRAANLHLQVSELKLRTASDGPHGGSEAAGNGGQEQFFWRPATFKSAKFLWGGEVDGIGSGVRLGDTRRPGSPPCAYSIRISCPVLSHKTPRFQRTLTEKGGTHRVLQYRIM